VAAEIERKFLVIGNGWRQGDGVVTSQGYLCLDQERTVRVRLSGEKAFLTIKGPTKGIGRPEFEYEIPRGDCEQLLKLCAGSVIEKRRYVVEYKGSRWDVDEFLGENAGLIVAEIELENENQPFERPGWLGAEVSGDPRYFNSSLASNPYSTWQNQEAVEIKLEALLEYTKDDGRICPNPREWAALWEMLPDKKRIGPSWEPPIPLILSVRRKTPLPAKAMLLEEHIRYAAEHGVLDEIDAYLRALEPGQWLMG